MGPTFIDNGHLEWYTDDAHQVCGRNQGAQDGPDTQCLTFTLIDQLRERGRERGEERKKDGREGRDREREG